MSKALCNPHFPSWTALSLCTPYAFQMLGSCELYLAPSTIPNAGLGIFTGRELHRGDAIGGSTAQEGDVAIPILDLEWHNAAIGEEESFANPYRDYVWGATSMGLLREGSDFEAITLFWPGLDAAINAYAPLTNVARALPDYDPDLNATMHRSKDPAMGSFSPYVGGRAFVKHFVPAGGELFKDYGDAWFRDRNMNIPDILDFIKAERFLRQFAFSIPHSFQSDVFDLIQNVKKIWDHPMVLRAIPGSWQDVEPGLLQYKQGKATIEQGLRQWYQPNATRSIEWLQEHGVCLDTLRSGISTLDGAGRGAFATRSFQEGDIVTTSPLIHTLDKSILDMHEIGPDPINPQKYAKLQKIGTQIAINYCYSHPETTLLLCPYGKGINSINHAMDKEKVNLRIEWPKDGFLNHNATFLTRSLQDWGANFKPQLALQFVATKSIAPGDELFLDYGEDWERAFQAHSRMWLRSEMIESVPHGKGYISSTTWNRLYGGKDTLWTPEEIQQDPSKAPPLYLQLRCHSDILTHRHARFYRLSWDGNWSNELTGNEYGRPCQVVGRQLRVSNNETRTESYSYNVVIEAIVDRDTWEIEPVEKFNIPRRLIRWFDQPHTTDLHLIMAFRHPLGLPDSMVSQEWRNVKLVKRTILTAPTPSTAVHEPRAEACPAAEAKAINDERTVRDTDASETPSYDHIPPHAPLICDIYLAPSSIPNAGLGVFAGRSYEVGESVGHGDLAIPLYGSLTRNDHCLFENTVYQNPFEDYVWNAKFLGTGTEFMVEDTTMTTFWPGLNAAANSFAPLINLQQTKPEWDSSLMHRNRDTGAGASSVFHRGVDKAKRSIPKGGEMFKNYGVKWFESRKSLEGLPVVEDYNRARELLKGFFRLWDESQSLNIELGPHVFDLMASIGGAWARESTTLVALPDTFEGASNLIRTMDGDFGLLHQPNHTREVSWLEKNGRCIDHIVPGPSSLKDAGKGAFAKRFLPKGTVLTGSPLLHVRRDRLVLRTSGDDPEACLPNDVTSSLPEHELLLNYCYGWSESSLLLCPYSTGVNYINHDRTRANVRVQWAQNGDLNHDKTQFDRSPLDFDQLKHPRLVFDYVVTKDIGPNEEIFLDYGDDWIAAWRNHSERWQPRPEWEHYISAHDFNEQVAATPYLRTRSEEETDPYPENLRIHCHSTLAKYSIDYLTNAGVDLDNPAHLQRIFPWKTDSEVEYGHFCRIVERTARKGRSNYAYTVEISVPDSAGTLNREGVPREAIRFFDEPYSTDLHLSTAFRHNIGLPDDMLPPAWRDVISKER